MKITRNRLRTIIKEEIEGIIREEEETLTADAALMQIIKSNSSEAFSEQGQGATMLSAVLSQHGTEHAAKSLGGKNGLLAKYNLKVTDEQKVALDL